MSLITDVEIQLNQPNGSVGDPGSAWWSQQQIIDAINVAFLDTWGLIRYAYTTSTITLTAGVPLVGYDTTTIMIPQFLLGTSSLNIFPTTYPMLEDWSSNWMNEPQACPQWFVKWDAQNIRLWPPPDQTYNFVMWGTPWPPLISVASPDILGLDPNLRNIIIHRAAGYLLEETQPQLADNYYADGEEHQKRFWRQVRNMQGDNTLRLAPGKGWVLARTGDIKLGRIFTPTGNPYT